MPIQAPPRTLVDVIECAEVHDSRSFLSYIDDLDQPPVETATYSEFLARARCAAANLYRNGVGVGDRVALVALPRVDYVVTLAGAILLGAVPAPINHHFVARELQATLTALRPTVVVVDDVTSNNVGLALAGLPFRPTMAGISGCSTGQIDLTDNSMGCAYPSPVLAAGDHALILHSSGTTGLPKLVIRTHGAITEFLNLFADYFGDDEHILNFLPLYHQAGLVLCVLAACRLGIDVLQASRFSTTSFWNLVDRYKATHVNLVSPMASFILSLPPAADDRDHPLRWVVIAGRNDHWADFQDRFGVVGMTFYGSTETLQITSTGTPKKGPVPRQTLMSVGSTTYAGHAIGGLTTFRLTGSDDRQITEPGVPGRIQVRGRFCFTEYLNQPDETAAAFTPDGWFITGDIGCTLPDGALVLVGRESGMIRRSGENIAPREIEVVLEDHDEVKEALVVGVPDDARGQEILARVVLQPGSTLSADDVFAYLAQNLSSFKVPRFLEFRAEFERTSTYKIKLRPSADLDGRAGWIDRLNS